MVCKNSLTEIRYRKLQYKLELYLLHDSRTWSHILPCKLIRKIVKDYIYRFQSIYWKYGPFSVLVWTYLVCYQVWALHMLATLVNTRANAAYVTCRRVIGVPEAMNKHLRYDMITFDPFRTVELNAQPIPSAARPVLYNTPATHLRRSPFFLTLTHGYLISLTYTPAHFGHYWLHRMAAVAERLRVQFSFHGMKLKTRCITPTTPPPLFPKHLSSNPFKILTNYLYQCCSEIGSLLHYRPFVRYTSTLHQLLAFT